MSRICREDHRDKCIVQNRIDAAIAGFKRSNEKLKTVADKTVKNLRDNGKALERVKDDLDAAKTV